MFLTHLSKREKLLLYITAGVIALSLLLLAARPLTGAWAQLNRQILEKELELKKNNRYLAQRNEIKRSFQNYQRYVQAIGNDESEETSLLNEVERLARSAGIRIADILPKPVKDMQYYKKYILELNCEAQMEALITFAYNLQTSSQLIRIEQLRLTSQGKGSSLVKARMLITKALITN